ncbi:MAG: glycosyltransferase family 4 protein [Myxococcaceae bacterium]
MKIVVVHQYYLMPGMAGGSRFNELARLWSEAGHQVTVVAGNLDYTTGKVPERYRGRWLVEEQDGPVRVVRCHVPGSYARGYAGRMWAFAGFTFSAVTAALQLERPDVVIATSPPLIAVIPGWVAARVRRQRAPWIFEMRDLWPESAVTTGVLRKGSLLTRGLYALERWASWSADRINVLTPAFRDDLVARGLASVAKIAFVPNGADVERFHPGPRDNEVRRKHGWGDRFVVMYAGAHGRANAVGQLLDAAERLRARPDILIASVGDGPERARLEEEARRRRLDNLVFCGSQPKDRMPDFVNACDVGAAVLQNNPTFRTVYPNKVFDYMACERPTLLAIDGVARKLDCDEAQAGVFAEPENPEAIANAIMGLAGDPAGRAEMGRRGREWVLANATREALAARYLSGLQELLA